MRGNEKSSKVARKGKRAKSGQRAPRATKTVRMTLEESLAAPDRTDWARVDAMTDEDIAQQIADDPDVAPEWTDEMFAKARWVEPAKKTPISFRVDPDVLSFFKRQGAGYQSRMNAVLRAYMEGRASGPPR